MVNGVEAIEDEMGVHLRLEGMQFEVNHRLPSVYFPRGSLPDPFFPMEKKVTNKRHA